MLACSARGVSEHSVSDSDSVGDSRRDSDNVRESGSTTPLVTLSEGGEADRVEGSVGRGRVGSPRGLLLTAAHIHGSFDSGLRPSLRMTGEGKCWRRAPLRMTREGNGAVVPLRSG